MANVSKNFSTSGANHRAPGRSPEMVNVGRVGGKSSMVVPGQGGISPAPGTNRNMGGDRSAQHHAAPMDRIGKGP